MEQKGSIKMDGRGTREAEVQLKLDSKNTKLHSCNSRMIQINSEKESRGRKMLLLFWMSIKLCQSQGGSLLAICYNSSFLKVNSFAKACIFLFLLELFIFLWVYQVTLCFHFGSQMFFPPFFLWVGLPLGLVFGARSMRSVIAHGEFDEALGNQLGILPIWARFLTK